MDKELDIVWGAHRYEFRPLAIDAVTIACHAIGPADSMGGQLTVPVAHAIGILDAIRLVTMVPGAKVKLVRPVDNGQDGYYEAGLTGTLTRMEGSTGRDQYWWVKLDKHFPLLNEWNNELQIWDWSENEGPDAHPSQSLVTI